MNIEECWKITEVADQLRQTKRVLMRLSGCIKRCENNGTEAFPELRAALDRFLVAADETAHVVDNLLDEGFVANEPEEFTEDDAQRLRNLNHAMNTISNFMHGTADTIRPAMQAKVADATDPMFDFEIEAKIDYELREEDPEYDEDIDNYLSSRLEIITQQRIEDEMQDDWRMPYTPEPFGNEPMSWLLHSLTEHSVGTGGHRVDARNCLRIGAVFLDIQVWWQYCFDVSKGKWVKRWRQPEGIPEYVESAALQDGKPNEGDNHAHDR